MLLEIANLSKRFSGSSQPAVANLCLAVARGEILGFVGLNGAGKTTTIRIASGLSGPTEGRVSIAGFDVVREKVDASRHLGLVPEFSYFDPGAGALPLLRYFAGHRGLVGSQATWRGRALLNLVGLGDAERSRVRTFSQGMKKRLALAVALLSDPEVLLLDEALNGLDPGGIALVRNLLLEWRKDGKAVLLSSHLLHEVQQVADRVAIVHRGRLVRVLPRDELNGATASSLAITFVTLDEAALSFLSGLGTIRTSGSTVWVSDPKAPPDYINSELIRRGYRIRRLSFEPATLEDLFFRTIGETPSESPVQPSGTRE